MRADRKTVSAGGGWIAFGALLLLAAALFAAKNLYEQRAAASRAEQLLEQVQQQLSSAAQPPAEGGEQLDAEAPLWGAYDVAGVLSLPDLGLELPVLADYSEELLKVSVCIFDEAGDAESPCLIIAGHNYRGHFGRLDRLPLGAEICYRPLNGEELCYTVTACTEIDAEDGDALEEGDWDLTLVTCNLDMSRRILVRCTRSAP